MKPTKPTGLITSPIHVAIVKAGGFGTRPCKEITAEIEVTTAKYGREAVSEASRDICEFI